MKNRSQGTSLIELMTCVAIGCIVLAYALPAMESLRRSQRQAQETNQLLGALHFARTQAALARRTITLCSGEARCQKSPTWQNNLLVFIDDNHNGQIDEADRLLLSLAHRQGLHWRWNSFQRRSYIQFKANGTTRASNGTFTLCQGQFAMRQVIVNLLGRVRTQSPSATARCP